MDGDIHYFLADLLRKKQPVVHCITNYVTARDVANIILACGGSPIMADHPEEVREVTAFSSSLLLNLGTLKEHSGVSMLRAGQEAGKRGIPIVLDPVGAGSSRHRTETALTVIKEVKPWVIRGNATELKAVLRGLKGQAMVQNSRGVDAAFCDRADEDSIAALLESAKSLSVLTQSVVVMTGTVDLVVSSAGTWIIKNGCPEMSRITGSGCMLDGVIASYVGAALLPYGEQVPTRKKRNLNQNSDMRTAVFQAAGLAAALCGICGERAAVKTKEIQGGTGSFHRFFLDEISLSDEKQLRKGARIEIQ